MMSLRTAAGLRIWVQLAFAAALVMALIAWRPGLRGPRLLAQEDAEAGPSAAEVGDEGADGAGDATEAADGERASSQGEEPAARGSRAKARKIESINILELLVSGGAWMIPIAGVSLLALTVVVERFIGLRRDRVIPESLVVELGRLGARAGGFDPRQAYRLCQDHPSAAATVIRAMLLKVGRPHSEVEHAVAEASDREANRLYANVRWLNFAAAVAPLLGLLGTVWGLIVSFHDTTHLLPGENKAEFLAKGIYIALVTTLAGLCVAIPAAFFSHMFEGRIQSLFHKIDELLFSLMPQIERYEGRVRFSRQMGDEEPGRDVASPPPVEPRTMPSSR